ncbi:hypothetical protein GA0115240_160621 [Streptomyces sp. DvalAA-14]|uniref:hypothetical protein n=1 Tax=unclassified Streptomyces TaxID=2593676 RepID=UPI00081B7206|nr:MULTISPECIES: hypothetical protein [unclassified Streptomyces]MYS24104.1 hypothetical protein [Streptomyces sp. SID4948]SCE42637.1 hypothetical protein GA0115240_160621 [Streptomyces sp. DvalAA-14]
MITEPEMAEEPESPPPADLVSDEDRRPLFGGSVRRQPWVWAAGGAVAASLAWAAALHVTHYGRTAAPDLHGYHLNGSPCTAISLEPLTDSVSAGSILPDQPFLRKGPALDHVYCALTSSLQTGGGWANTYVVEVTVDLHKKTDPRAEFTDTYNPPVSSPTMGEVNGTYVLPDPGAVTRIQAGIGDLAYVSSGTTHQSLSVLYGGAVVSLSVDAIKTWEGGGKEPTTADGNPPAATTTVDITALRPVVLRTVRHLMSELSS